MGLAHCLYAFMPLLLGLFDAYDKARGSTGLPRYAEVVWATAPCLYDLDRLRRAGLQRLGPLLLSLLIVPVYLFLRAHRVKQVPYYGFVWIILVFLVIVLDALD